MTEKEYMRIAENYRNKYCKILATGHLDYIRLLGINKLPWEPRKRPQTEK